MKTLDVAVIQTAPVFGDLDGNLHDALARIPAGCDLAVLPELFASGYQFRSADEARSLAEPLCGPAAAGSVRARLADFAAASGTTVVAGLAEIAGERLYNSSLLVRPDGSQETYRKVHLFWDEKSIFSPGDLGFPVFAACGTTVGMMICFDWIFPEAARSLALAGAQVLCHPSNLLLPWCPAAMITRCQENRVFALTSNRVGREDRTGHPLEFIGLSQVVSPLGERLAGLPERTPGTARAQLRLAETDKLFTPRNDLWEDRRPDMYRL